MHFTGAQILCTVATFLMADGSRFRIAVMYLEGDGAVSHGESYPFGASPGGGCRMESYICDQCPLPSHAFCVVVPSGV